MDLNTILPPLNVRPIDVTCMAMVRLDGVPVAVLMHGEVSPMIGLSFSISMSW